jgi:hypothetical protein
VLGSPFSGLSGQLLTTFTNLTETFSMILYYVIG